MKGFASDNYASAHPEVLAAIADGIGGARAGAEASQIAVATAFRHINGHLDRQTPRTEAQWQQLLIAAIRSANTAVYHRATSTNRLTMGTTLMCSL